MRRILISIVCLLLLGLSAGASFALAPQDRTTHERSWLESPAPSGFLAVLSDLFVRVWARTSCQIDPAGRCHPNHAPTATPPSGDPSSAQVDTGCEIDPLGGCAVSR